MKKLSASSVILKMFLCTFTCFLVPGLLYGQVSSDTESKAAEEPREEPRFVVGEVRYTIEGKTRKKALIHYLEIEEDKSFTSEEELYLYIEDKEQMLENQRTLSEGEISPSFRTDPENPGRRYVDLEVYVKDTWNYIVLPYARYDSNEGFLLSLRGRNYNFLGGMEALSVDLDYLRTVDKENEYSVAGSFAVPFFWWGYYWKFSIKEDVAYTVDEPLRMDTKAEVTLEIPTDFHTWQAKLFQEYHLNEDYESEEEPDPDKDYYLTGAKLGSSIPSGLEVPGIGELDYTPGIFYEFPFKPGERLSNERRGGKLGFDHGLSAGRIDWNGNFRDGIETSLTHSQAWNFKREIWLAGVGFDCEMHKSFDWMGISSRLQAFYRHTGVKEKVGSDLRGILDKRIEGDAGLTANLAFPVDVWMWFLSDWFEGHISPFFDYALVRPENGGFDIYKGWYGGGIEILGFPKFARSIYARISVGVDLEAMVDGGKLSDPAPRDGEPRYELYLGLGHHY